MFKNLLGDLRRLGLSIEPDKLELMHFSRKRKTGWPDSQPFGPPVTVRIDGRITTVRPTGNMRYLGFFLDPKLSFKEHIRFYATKACSTVNALRMLGNSIRGFNPVNKRRLYVSNVLPVMTYGAQLWWHPQWKGMKWAAHELQKAQSRAARWITGCFRTTPIGALEMMAALLPIRIQINKFMQRAALRVR